MTVCCDEGTLQAFLDGEAVSGTRDEIEEHLQNCRSCRDLLGRLRENQSFTDARLDGYVRSRAGAARSRSGGAPPAGRGSTRLRKGVFEMLSKYRMAAIAAAVVLALAVSLSFGSVRSAAGELLAVFRVEKVKTVSITPEDMTRIEKALREGAGEIGIENFGTIELKFEGTPGPVTLEEARAAADFPLKLPAAFPDGFRLQEINKNPEGTLNFTLDTESANRILRSFGSVKLLPGELNGKTFTVKAPVQFITAYAGPDNRRIFVGQSRSPELIAPVEDVSAVRDALLALPFLPENLRSQLASIGDWQHTFVIPDFNGTSREVDVAGSQGVFIGSSAGGTGDREFSGSLIWQKAGTVYMVGGSVTLEQALEIASSMK
ncbi:MAG TPA: zf-HC2 domain-containing protein [Bacillota bacterium]|nr:zf-HC2 domain-containing protein [Bacillota bacterium]